MGRHHLIPTLRPLPARVLARFRWWAAVLEART